MRSCATVSSPRGEEPMTEATVGHSSFICAMRALLVFSCWAIVRICTAQTPICLIQGTGASSSYAGQTVTTTGIITAIFSGTGTLQGWFLEDPGCDANATTSNGIFVYQPNATGIGVGQRVSVTATVTEFQGVTELTGVTNRTVIGSGTVTPTDVSLPIASAGDWERYEGMLLRFPQGLEVVSNEDWAQYGEVLLAPGRLYTPTTSIDPNDAVASGNSTSGAGNAAAVAAQADADARSVVLLDDGRTSSYATPYPLIDGSGTLRCGSTIAGLTAVLHYAYSSYRLIPAGPVSITHAARPAAPAFPGGLRLASFNVHNYYTSLGSSGAATAEELVRQRTKLVAALQGLDADVVGLCEIQNNATAWSDLLVALNAAVGAGTYDGVVYSDPGTFTRSAIFFKPSVVQLVTPTYGINTSTFERAQITQGFRIGPTGGRFLFSMVHLRSKLCDNASGANLDQGDGQGCYNARRRSQALELLTHWSSLRGITGIDAQVAMGDFNANTQEDPLDALRAGGLIDLLPADAYTYRYDKRFGALDHAFCTPLFHAAVTGAAPWAINSDEPPALDYPSASHFQPNAFRSSDHDPVVVGLNASGIVSVEEVSLQHGDVDFMLDADARSGRWEAQGLFTLEVADASGRRVAERAVAQPWQSVVFGLMPPGAYAWRAILEDGRFASGRFVLP